MLGWKGLIRIIKSNSYSKTAKNSYPQASNLNNYFGCKPLGSVEHTYLATIQIWSSIKPCKINIILHILHVQNFICSKAN